MSVIVGSKAAVYIAAQVSTAGTNVALTDSGDHKTYTISVASKRYLDDAVAVVVQESTDSGSSWHAAPANTVQYVGGVVTFSVANSAANQYRLSTFNYLPITQVAQAHGWTLTAERNLVNTNVFGDTWEASKALLGKWSGTFDQFYLDNTFMVPTSKMVVSLYVDSANDKRYEGFAVINQSNPSADENGLVTEKVSFTGTGTLYNTTV